MTYTPNHIGQQVSPARVGRVELIGWAAAGTILSVAFTGFVLGASNNLFHLPIVAALFDEPQYRDDAFIQSLRHFSSGLWLLLSGSEKYIDPYWLFLGLHILSRFLAFSGFLACAGLLGVRSRADIAAFTAMLAVCSLMQGASYAGAGGLFFATFTHSEVANGLTLFMIYFIVRGRLVPSFAMNGAIFFVNAFVAVWNAVPLLIVIVSGLIRRDLRLRRVVVDGGIGLALFLVIASPVIVNVLGNPDFGRATDFDYVAFLNSYYPNHFLAGSLPTIHIVAAALVVSIGAISFSLLGPVARPFQLILAGYVIVYLIGVGVPHISHNAALLNLHLLRVSTFFHVLATLGCLTLLTRWFRSDDRLLSRLLAPGLLVVIGTVQRAGLIAPLLMLAAYLPARVHVAVDRLIVRLRWSREAILSVGIVALVWAASSTWTNNRKLNAWMGEWTELGHWARSNTPEHAVFAVPTADLTTLAKDKSPQMEAAWIGPATFEFASHRRVWIDFRRGAAVMWSSSYYETWRQRVNAQLSLKTHDERLNFARLNGIDHVIDICTDADQAKALKRTAHLCVFDAKPL